MDTTNFLVEQRKNRKGFLLHPFQRNIRAPTVCDSDIDAVVENDETLCMPQQETQFWELRVGELNVSIPVKNRLKANLAIWRGVLQAPPAVLDVIESGYVLPLMSGPYRFLVIITYLLYKTPVCG